MPFLVTANFFFLLDEKSKSFRNILMCLTLCCGAVSSVRMHNFIFGNKTSAHEYMTAAQI